MLNNLNLRAFCCCIALKVTLKSYCNFDLMHESQINKESVSRIFKIFSNRKFFKLTLNHPNLYLGKSFYVFLYIFTKGRPSPSKRAQYQVCMSKNGREKGWLKKHSFRETPCRYTLYFTTSNM